jgi:thioredoxin
MKRTVVLVVTVMAFGLTACTQNNKPSNNNKEQANAEISIKGDETNGQEEGNEQSMSVKEMNAEMFKHNIMDYKKNPNKWQFKGDKPAIIDFYATWCGPCQMTAPILEEVARDYNGQIDVYKVDVDKQRELAELFDIRAIPAILFIPKVGEPKMKKGAMNREEFEEAIKSTLLQ